MTNNIIMYEKLQLWQSHKYMNRQKQKISGINCIFSLKKTVKLTVTRIIKEFELSLGEILAQKHHDVSVLDLNHKRL